MKKITDILSIPFHLRTEFESLELLQLTETFPFFSKFREKFSEVFHQKCCKSLTLEKFSKNQYIYQKGDASVKYYIIIQGEVSLLKSRDKDKEIISSSNSSSSSELDESFGLNNTRPRFRAFDLNSDLVFELSNTTNNEFSRKSISILTKDVLEKESKELLELIFQVDSVNESDKQLKVLKSKEGFGTEALLQNKPRQFHAVAKTQVELASLHKTMFRKIILEIATERKMVMMGFLSRISLFSKWTKNELLKILHFFHLKSFQKGQYIFRQGEKPGSVYFVSTGNFAISKNCPRPVTQESFSKNDFRTFSSNQKKRLIKLDLVIKGEYEILGAEEVLNNHPIRAFSCVCNSATAEAYEVSKADFERLIKPEVLKEFLMTLKVNNIWLKTRSESLEENQKNFESFDFANQKKTEPQEYRRKSVQNAIIELKKEKNLRYALEKVVNTDDCCGKPLRSQRVYWKSCETENIHLKGLKKNNPRLAPRSFLKSLRDKQARKVQNLSFDFSLYRNF